MTKFIGRQFNIALSKETTRATPAPASAGYFMPWTTLTIDDQVKSAKDETSVGVIEDGVGQENTTIMSKGAIEGRITDISFGAILNFTMGTNTLVAVAGETLVKDHQFNVLETAQHPSFTVTVVEPNSNAGLGYGYPLGMVNSLDIDFALDEYSMYKMDFDANEGANLPATVSYTAQNAFRPQDGAIVTASLMSQLSSSTTTVAVKKASITIKKNTVADTVIGNTSPIDRLNQGFQVDGSLELYYNSRTFIDTDMLADIYQAIQLKFANTSVTIGNSSNPTLTIQLAAVKMTSVARKIDLKGIVSQTVKFTAFYSLAQAAMLQITLRNTNVSVY